MAALLVALPLAARRGANNLSLLAVLALWYISYMGAQEVMGMNSPYAISMAITGILTIPVVTIGATYKILWPFIIAGLLLSSSLLDIIYGIAAMNGAVSWNRLYQDIGAGLFYICVLLIMLHPKLEGYNGKLKYSYT